MKAASACLLLGVCSTKSEALKIQETVDQPLTGPGTWTEATLQFDGASRMYLVYEPATGANDGLMIFLHGQGGSANQDAIGWDVATKAEQHGFIGVIPQGTPYSGLWPAYEWNVDDPNGSNEVAFVHTVVSQVTAAYSVPAGAPKVVLGFSNGAALASYLGCFDSSQTWVATVGVHYRADADYPSTCGSMHPGVKGATQPPSSPPSARGCPEYLAVGENDFFIDSLEPTPTAGVLAQFSDRRIPFGCPTDSAWNVTANVTNGPDGDEYVCYHYPDCLDLGQLCIYADIGHAIFPSMASTAWSFLTGPSGGCANEGPPLPPRPPPPPPLPTPPPPTLLASIGAYLLSTSPAALALSMLAEQIESVSSFC